MIYKEIPTLNGYLASSSGVIVCPCGYKLKQYDCKGYKRVYANKKQHLVHRLVAMAFLENKENKPAVNHKDLNKSNNNISNLEWCTIAENNKHAFDNGVGLGFFHTPKGKIVAEKQKYARKKNMFTALCDRFNAIDLKEYELRLKLKPLKKKLYQAIRSGSQRRIDKVYRLMESIYQERHTKKR